MVAVTVKHIDNMQFQAEDDIGSTITMDASSLPKDQRAGMSPIRVLLSSLGACSGVDVIEILKKKKQDVTGYEINVSGDRREDYPRIFNKINVEHVVKGRNLNPIAVQKAVELSTEKYCSVIGMLKDSTQIEVSFKIVDAE